MDISSFFQERSRPNRLTEQDEKVQEVTELDKNHSLDKQTEADILVRKFSEHQFKDNFR